MAAKTVQPGLWLAGMAFLLIACAAGEATPATSLPSSTDIPAAVTFAPADVVTCTHYISPTGDDSAPGTSDQPWATFSHAAETAAPGDVVCFRAGTYAAEEILLTQSGTPDAPITFMAAPGEAVTLDAGGQAGGVVTIKQGASYLRLSGFTLTGFTIWGLYLEGSNHDVYLDHLDIGGGEAGVHFTLGASGEEPEFGPVERVTLEDSFIHDVAYTAVDCTPGPCNDMTFRRLEISGAGLVGEASFGADGLAVERGQDILVADSAIHDNGGDGIDLNSRDHEGHVTGILVARNQVYRNHLQGIKLWAGGRMENNAVWGQGINPVVIGIFPGAYEVVNNTIAYNMQDPAYSARDYAFVAAYPETGQSAAIGLAMVNNIFAFNGGAATDGPTGIYLGAGVRLTAESGNLYFSREDCEIEANFAQGRDPCITQSEISGGVWAQITGFGAGDMTLDPLFLSGWPGVDLHLQPDSPAINIGSGDYVPPDDLDGQPRDDQPDAGADEVVP